MPSVHGQNNLIMEKQRTMNTIGSTPLGGESSTFICTECGDGFSHYSNVLAHMAVHGPLESFTFDGSSNGFEIPREYVLQENGTLTALNGLVQSRQPVRPLSPGVLPSHFTFPVKPLSPNLKPQPSPHRDVLRPRPSDLNLDKSQQSRYCCETCNKSFNSLQSLHCHQQYRNIERGYKCTLCCKLFGGREDLTEHLHNHANERFHCCCHCGKRFLKVEALNAHKKENHNSHKATALGKPENKQEKKFEKTYSCKKCKLNFFWMSDFQTHSLYHCKGIEPDAPLTSEIDFDINSKNIKDRPNENCYSNGTSVDDKIDSKVLTNSSGQPDTEHSFTPYRCGLCGDRFQNLTSLKEHHLTHQTQEEIDQLKEESQRTIKPRISPKGKRKRSNPNGKLHPCKHCHRVFNHSSSLSRHMRYHKGTMHTCAFCGRHFPQRCDLRRHIAMYHKTELDKKPGLKHMYTSSQNGPAPNYFNGEKNTLAPDERINSSYENEQTASPEENPNGKQSGRVGRVNYKCQECGKRFGLLCVYQRHLRYHKKEPSKCPKCPAQFRNPSSLGLHLQNHPNIGENCDIGEMCHNAGSINDTAQEKGNAKDLEGDYMDNTQNEKGNSTEVLYECTECTETFSCLETFLHHQTSHGSESNG